MLRVAAAAGGETAEALVVARAWTRPSATDGLARAGILAVPLVTLAAVGVTLVVGHARLAPYVLGLGGLSLVDLALGRWVDRRCQERLRGRTG